jgi:prepilin-type N-terminal cleavage/methylation domain-containing protein
MKNEKGFSLIELMIVCMIAAVLVCAFLPNATRVLNAVETREAHDDVRQVQQLATASILCAVNPTPPPACASISASLPVNGSITSDGYTYAATGMGTSAWTYTATPANGQATDAFYVDVTGILRCSPRTVNGGSPICP